MCLLAALEMLRENTRNRPKMSPKVPWGACPGPDGLPVALPSALPAPGASTVPPGGAEGTSGP